MNINKKIFASALFIVGAFVSSIASATITYTNSVASATDAQNANAVVVAGGGAVRANDLILQLAGNPDVVADDKIIVRLPAGFNFASNPVYAAERLNDPGGSTGLTLKDATVNGDPTLGDNVGLVMSDTDGDGGDDRAEVEVSSLNTAGDTLTISINVTADSSVKAGTYEASVIVAGNLAVVQEIADVVTSLSTPVSSASSGQAETDQTGDTGLDTSGAKFVVTIPAGTAGGKTLTLTPNSGVEWSTNGSTITWTVHTPGFAVDALTPTSTSNVVAGPTTTATVTLKTNWASSATNDSPIQVAFEVSELDALAGNTGLRGLAVAGTAAGAGGNVQLIEVLPNGSQGQLSTGAKVTTLVAGSSAAQALPTIEVDENFDLDMGTTLTITADTGLTFIYGGDVAVGGVSGTVSVNAASSVITITVTANTPAFDTLTLSGVTAIADSDASGDLGVTVSGPSGVGLFPPNDDELVVADAVPVGVVEVSLSGKAANVGTDTAGTTSVIDLNETTYGSLSTAAETQVQDAYFRITPSSNADITAVTVATSDYAAGTSPTIAIATPCAAENNVTTGAWLCEVETESTAVVAGTSTISVSVTYDTDGAAVGETVDMTLDGNAEVSGSVTVANVKIATTADVTTAIPDLEPGDDTAKALATLEIEENFTGAIKNGGSLRLVAPSGVAFQDAASVQAQTDIGTATITATFSPNDTLVLDVSATTSITVIAKAVVADGLSGKISVTIYDGDIDGNNGAGVTSEDVVLLYAGVLDTLDGGDDADVNVGFKVTNTVEGGLAPYTAVSGSTGIATEVIDGNSITVTGVAVGMSTITVTDDLGATATYDVDVAVGGTQPDATKAAKALDGSTTAATFTAGASSDGGTTYGTEFTTADSVTLVGTINVDPADQGSNGEVHVLVSAVTGAGVSIFSLDVDGNADDWDGSLEDIAANIVATPLGATYTVTIVSDEMLAAGTYRVALAYSTEGGKLVYTAKAMVITVTE